MNLNTCLGFQMSWLYFFISVGRNPVTEQNGSRTGAPGGHPHPRCLTLPQPRMNYWVCFLKY